MRRTVTVIAAGAMGAAVGGRLVEHGTRVTTVLDGRSGASAARARKAGMEPVGIEEAASAAFILSIVPPGAAYELAARLAPVLAKAPRKPVYVDCNAVSPRTVGEIAALFAPADVPFVDAGIIGGPPQPGSRGPAFYASGEAAARLAELREQGLDVRVMEGPVGAASALKMAYAGITKGLTALGTAMILAATRAGAGAALRAELAESQPALLAFLSRSVPGMYPKAYRWVAEMEEIAAFAGADPAAHGLYDAAARLYARIAADVDGPNEETASLTRFFG